MLTFSVMLSTFSELELLTGGRSPVIGFSLAPCLSGSRPVVPICGASVQETLSESPGVELSISSKLTFVHSVSVPRILGNI